MRRSRSRTPMPDGRRAAVPGPKDDDSWIEVRGRVVRLLHGEDERHQRFVLDIGDGHTVLIAHNVEVSERVPLGLGDRVTVRGLFEWSERGGLLHWTHADPMGHEQDGGGYIRFGKRTYA